MQQGEKYGLLAFVLEAELKIPTALWSCGYSKKLNTW